MLIIDTIASYYKSGEYYIILNLKQIVIIRIVHLGISDLMVIEILDI